jgi:carbonic anhydrase
VELYKRRNAISAAKRRKINYLIGGGHVQLIFIGWKNVSEEGGSNEAKHISFLTISNQAESIIDDVKRIKSHPLVPSYIPVYGYIYDVKSGKLIEIPEATQVGRAS